MRLVEKVHAELAKALRPGDVAIDATAGNGHDAAHLAALVGESGKVHAFDLQQAAMKSTERRLRERGLLDHCSLHQVGHEHLAEALPPETKERTRAIVFNLGYLPGGDKSVVTTSSSTLKALRVALNWLAPGGILTVTAYRGHPGGKEEASKVGELLSGLEVADFKVSSEQPSTESNSPIAFIVRRREQAEGRPSV